MEYEALCTWWQSLYTVIMLNSTTPFRAMLVFRAILSLQRSEIAPWIRTYLIWESPGSYLYSSISEIIKGSISFDSCIISLGPQALCLCHFKDCCILVRFVCSKCPVLDEPVVDAGGLIQNRPLFFPSRLKLISSWNTKAQVCLGIAACRSLTCWASNCSL